MRRRRATWQAAWMAGIVFAALAMLFSTGSLLAQSYPNKPVKLIVGFPPSGITDIVARIIGEALAKELGQPVVIENRTGAAGVLAAQVVATSPKDGYTLLLAPGGHALYGAILNTLPFDPVDGFDWISNIVTTPFFVVVAQTSPIKSVGDLIAKAKAEPGGLRFGSAGVGSPTHLGAELLAMATGTSLLHVPYRGEGAVIPALVSGEIAFAVSTTTSLGNAGIRPIAVTTNVRSSKWPDVPTVQDSLGLSEFDVRSWLALAGPAGMPEPVVTRLNAELRKALQHADVRTRLDPVGGNIGPSSPKEQRDRVARELQMWTKIVTTAGVPKQ